MKTVFRRLHPSILLLAWFTTGNESVNRCNALKWRDKRARNDSRVLSGG